MFTCHLYLDICYTCAHAHTQPEDLSSVHMRTLTSMKNLDLESFYLMYVWNSGQLSVLTAWK